MTFLIDASLAKEMDNKRGYIKDNSAIVDIMGREYLIEEANQHSARIEKPKALLYDPNVSADNKIERKRELEYYRGSLREAWNKGMQNLVMPLSLTEDFIRFIAAKIDPCYFEEYSAEVLQTGSAPYRRLNDAVRPTGATHTPPYPAKIPSEMEELIKNIQQFYAILSKGELHPTELAGFSHLHIARIHPFPDVNGRTSRMIQNLILADSEFPPVVLYEGERRSYHLLIGKAIKGYHRRDGKKDPFNISDEEKQFFTFIADKVNVSLDKILDTEVKK